MPSAAKGGVSRHALPIIPGPLDTIATRSLGVNGERGRSLGVNREKRRALSCLDTRRFGSRTLDERARHLCRPHSPHPLMPSAAEGGVSRHALPITPGPLNTLATRYLGVTGDKGRSIGINDD